MMSRHFALSSEHSGAISKRLPHAKNQLSVLGSFFKNNIQNSIQKDGIDEIGYLTNSDVSYSINFLTSSSLRDFFPERKPDEPH